jgi:hypothetical protein
MELWTVDVCTVRPGSDKEFIRLLREHSVGGDRFFLDFENSASHVMRMVDDHDDPVRQPLRRRLTEARALCRHRHEVRSLTP